MTNYMKRARHVQCLEYIHVMPISSHVVLQSR